MRSDDLTLILCFLGLIACGYFFLKYFGIDKKLQAITEDEEDDNL
jgi:hypothetical protein